MNMWKIKSTSGSDSVYEKTEKHFLSIVYTRKAKTTSAFDSVEEKNKTNFTVR